MRNGPYWLRDLNAWSSVGRAEVMRRGSCWKYVTGGRFWEFKVSPHFQFALCTSSASGWRGDPLASRSCFKLPYLHPQRTPILLEPNAKINSFISYPWSWGFITAIDKQLRRKRSGGRAHSWFKQGHSSSRWGSSCVAGLWTTWSHDFQSGSRECTGSWAERQNLKLLPPSWWTVFLIWPLPPATLNLLKGPKLTQTVTPAGDKCSNT